MDTETTHLDTDGLAKCSAGTTENPHARRQTPTLRVETPGGPIEAHVSIEPDFPAIDIQINGVIAAIVEYVKSEGRYVIRTFTQDQDEPCHNIDYTTGEEKGV